MPDSPTLPKTAPPRTRLFAFALELAFVTSLFAAHYLIAIAIGYFLGGFTALGYLIYIGLPHFTFVALCHLYFFIRHGQTPIQKLLNLKIVRTDYTRASPLHMLANILRSPFTLIPPTAITIFVTSMTYPIHPSTILIAFAPLALLAIYIPRDPKRRTVYDILTNTRVVSPTHTH